MERPAYRAEDEREYLARGCWRDDDTLWQWLGKHAASRPDAPAVGRLTWQGLHERVLRVAEGLRRKGIGKGDVVSLLMPNSAEYIIAYFACWKLGALAGPVNSLLKEHEIEFVMNNSEAKAMSSGVICSMPSTATAPSAGAETPGRGTA